MQAAREAQEKNGKLAEKVKNGEISAKELLGASLPKQVQKEVVYVDVEVPVIKEVRVINSTEGTDLTVEEIIRKELDLVRVWEFQNIPITEMSVEKLRALGKAGWKFAFEVGPEISTAYKVTTFVFQRAKKV